MIINITPNKERAKSILKIVQERKKTLKYIKKSGFATSIAEHYYEIIKELLTAILYTQGKKSIGKESHKDLIAEISKQETLNKQESSIINDLRIKRNKSQYYGEDIPSNYLNNYERNLIDIIKKLEIELSKKLN